MPRAKKPQGNRTDLNSPLGAQAASSRSGDRQYGDRKQDMDAQKAVPMRRPPGVPMQEQAPTPGDLGALARASERPDEPVTAGSPSGLGPGPEALSSFTPPPDIRPPLVRLQQKLNDPYLARLIGRGANSA